MSTTDFTRSALFALVLTACASSPPPAHLEIKSSKSIPKRSTETTQTSRPTTTSSRASSSSGISCEEARDSYTQELKLGGKQADVSAGAYGEQLNKGAYLSKCDVFANVSVHICAAIQNGHAVGVTVTLTPSDPDKANCVADAVRELTFPASPSLDVTNTTFE